MSQKVCKICGAKYDNEALVRAHISFSQAGDHANRTGFAAEDVFIENHETPNQNTEKGGIYVKEATISESELPDNLSQASAVVIKTAVNSNWIIDSQELIDQVNTALRAEGLSEQSDSEIMRELNEFFDLDATGSVEFEGLSDIKQRILKEYADNPSSQLSELAEEVDVSPSYFAEVIEQHTEILERTSVEEMNEHTENESPTTKTILYNGTELTETKTAIVEYLARNPTATNREISEAVGCSISYPSPVRDQYSDLIRMRAEHFDSDLDALNESLERCQKKRADSWEELTHKQQEVLRRLSEEPDPSKPASSLRNIIQDLSFETHPSYISDIKEKYVEFALELKEARTTVSDEAGTKPETDTESVDNQVNQNLTKETEEKLRELLQFAQKHIQMAQFEIENSTSSDSAVGRLVVARQVESELQKYLNMSKY